MARILVYAMRKSRWRWAPERNRYTGSTRRSWSDHRYLWYPTRSDSSRKNNSMNKDTLFCKSRKLPKYTYYSRTSSCDWSRMVPYHRAPESDHTKQSHCTPGSRRMSGLCGDGGAKLDFTLASHSRTYILSRFLFFVLSSYLSLSPLHHWYSRI